MGLSLYHKFQTVADGVYVADGSWGVDYQIADAMIYDYKISPNDFSTEESGYAVERNVLIQGTLKNRVAVYRALNPAFRSIDLDAYNLLSFDAQGTGDLEITIIREGVEEWEQQMKTAVKLTKEKQRFEIPIHRFYSPEALITWSDVKMLVFALKGGGKEVEQFSLKIEDIYFQEKEKLMDFYLVEGFQSAIFPNPLVDQSTIFFRTESSLNYSFQLLSASGIVINESQGFTTSGINELPVRNENYLPGLYFYNILLSNGEIYSGKVFVYKS